MTFNEHNESKVPTIKWAGREWLVRDNSWKPGGPIASHSWNASNVQPLGESLSLTTKMVDGKATGAEIVSKEPMGYGRYSFSFDVNTADFDQYAIFGAFTFDWDPEAKPGFSEVDAVEISKWGNAKAKSPIAKFTHYVDNKPEGTSEHCEDLPEKTSFIQRTVIMDWSPGKITRAVKDHYGNILHSSEITKSVPKPTDTTQFHFNVWAYGLPDAQTECKKFTAYVTDFTYTPASQKQLAPSTPSLPAPKGTDASASVPDDGSIAVFGTVDKRKFTAKLKLIEVKTIN